MMFSVVFLLAFAVAGSFAFSIGGFPQTGGFQRLQTGGFNPSFGLGGFSRFQFLNRGNAFQRNRGLQNFQTAGLFGVEPEEYLQYNLLNQGGFGLNQLATLNYLDFF